MVDAFISIAMEKLVGLGDDELKLLCGTREELDKLSDTLKVIHPYLRDVEVRQYFKDTEDPKVEDWLTRLKYVVYEADDVLDEWQTKYQQLWSQQQSIGANLVWSFFAQCTCFRQLALSHSVGKKIQKINKNLDHIVTLGKKFDFLKCSSVTTVMGEGTNFPIVIRNARKTTSSVEEIFGREDEIKRIKDTLISSTSYSETSKLAVVSIVGPAGFGKTTIAKFVFNDGEIVQYFKERIWVCVSDEFDETSIIRKIIEVATKEPCPLKELEALQRKLADDVLSDKLFLLVLDDVWNEDDEKWEKLFNVIKNCGLRGSRIVVTTRSEIVCEVVGSAQTLPVGIVSSFEHCWSIFESVAFESTDESERPKLRMVGEEIVKKCKGVPLAIKTVAGALRTKKTKEDWEYVLKSDMWDWKPKSKTGILPALFLSYYHLSPPLKKCFRYCAIYPKDYRISKDKIVRQWIAHGYILEKKNMEMEDVAKKYFDELVACSLFQEPELDEYDINNITQCKMHDLVHDLALFVTKGEFVYISEEKNIAFDTQYPPLHCTSTDTKLLNNIKIDVEKLRTFMCEIDEGKIGMPNSQIDKMQHLRVLELQGWNLEMLPNVVGKLLGKLLHLRYLNLSESELKALPSSIGKLQNLLYLDLSGTSIEALSESVRMLRKLRHLDLSWSKNLKALPSTIGKLTNLRKLDLKRTRLDEIPSSIGELQNLLYLHLSHTSIEALPESVGMLRKLRHLDLSWSKNLKALPSTIGRLTNLTKLDLHYSALDEIPDCIGKLGSLLALDVSDCKNLEKLPESIKDLSSLQALNVRFCRKLEQLPAGIFDKMTGLKELSVVGSGLQGLPAGIGKQTDLQRLDHFWVLGSHEGSSSSSSSNICELRDLNHLHDFLYIHNLDTVASGEDAASAQLHNKNSLTFLTLSWNTDGPGGAKEETTSEDVLQALRPCPTLPRLQIYGYPGRTVPTWLGNSTALRQLRIRALPKVRRVGAEWFGSNHGFPKLEYLLFAHMSEWEEWDSLVQELFFTFPCLSQLHISDCPKLRSLPPIFSTSLREIDVDGCPNLSNWLGILPPSLVKLRSISAEWVNEIPSLPNLVDLTIRGDDGVSELSNHLVNKLDALKWLYIEDCPNLESLPQEMASLKQLQELAISNCPKLKESCNKEGAQWYKIQHIPRIRIDREDVQSSDDDE